MWLKNRSVTLFLPSNTASSWVTPEIISSSSKSAKENDTRELTYKTERDSQTERMNLPLSEGKNGGRGS